MYILNYEINLVWVLILVNIGVVLALILVLIELRSMRKLRESFERMFGKHEKILEKEEEVFWKELQELGETRTTPAPAKRNPALKITETT